MTKNTENASNLTSSVAQRRCEEFAADFPTLNRDQFASEDEYRQALIDQYKNMRQVEYQQTCLNEGLKAYDVSISICSVTNDNKYMNRAAWNGCSNIMNRCPADMQTAIADSCYTRIPTNVTNSLAKGNGSYSCCGVSSKALESQISAKMGFDGNDNFVKPYNTMPLASCHRAADGFRNDPACKEYVEHGNLWNIIEKGKAGPGATIAIKSGVTDSGYHAKTIIGVSYDENGKLKNYTLQGNNANTLEVISNPNATKYQNVYVGDMNRWMNKQLEKEAVNSQSLTTEQLETRVAQQRNSVTKQIEQLSQTEQALFSSHPRNSQVDAYADHYIKNANVPDALGSVMQADQSNANKKSQTEVARVQNAQTQSGTQRQQQAPAQPTQVASTPEQQGTQGNNNRRLPFRFERINNGNSF